MILLNNVTYFIQSILAQYIYVQCSALQCSAVQCSAVHCIVLHYSEFQFSSWKCTALHVRAIHYNTRTNLHQSALGSSLSFSIKYTLSKITAVHQGVSKYLTAQDTHISPTSTNRSSTLSSHGNLLSLQSKSTIQEYKTVSVPSIE